MRDLLLNSAVACGCHITNPAVELRSIGNSDLCHIFTNGETDWLSQHLKNFVISRAAGGNGLAAVCLFTEKGHWISGCPMPTIGLN